jgi:hypothetical protein
MSRLSLPENQLHATLPPPIMHACRESRRYAKYQKASLSPSSPQYIWANFENDVVCIDFEDFINNRHGLEEHRSQIRRLRLAVDFDSCYDILFYHAHNFLEDFTSLDELHLFVVAGGMTVWTSVFEDRGTGSFPAEKVRYIDSASGLVLTGQQLVMCLDWNIFHSWEHGYGGPDYQSLDQAASTSYGSGHMRLWDMHQVG